MSVDLRTRQRILKAVEDIRNAVAKLDDHDQTAPTASVHQLRLKRAESPSPSELHLMLPKPHTSIW
jgi:hypothetical protein